MRRAVLSLFLVIGCAEPAVSIRTASPDVDLEVETPNVAPDDKPDEKPPPLTLPNPAISFECGDRAPMIRHQTSDVANDVEFDKPCIQEALDENGCVGARLLNTFDAHGRIIRIEEQIFDPDVLQRSYVVPESQITWLRYDARGNIIEQRTDLRADGTLDHVAMMRFDAEDRIVERTRLRDGVMTRETWVYDDAGREISRTSESPDQTRRTDTEWSGDNKVREQMYTNGELVFERTHRYDDQGRLVHHRTWNTRRVETDVYHYTATGLAERVWTRGQNSRHIIERWIYTRRDDGTLEQELILDARGNRRTTTYDEAGREIRVEQDDRGDGSVDWFREQSWDADGNRLESRTVRGNQVLLHVRDVYENGELVRREDHVNGTVSTASRSGNVHRRTVERFDGTVLSSVVSHLDEHGNVILRLSDRYGDGSVVQRSEARYDGTNLVSSRTDNDGDGRWDYQAGRTYDRAGQLLYSFTDIGGDGTRDKQELTSYACLLR